MLDAWIIEKIKEKEQKEKEEAEPPQLRLPLHEEENPCEEEKKEVESVFEFTL